MAEQTAREFADMVEEMLKIERVMQDTADVCSMTWIYEHDVDWMVVRDLRRFEPITQVRSSKTMHIKLCERVLKYAPLWQPDEVEERALMTAFWDLCFAVYTIIDRV